MGSAVPVRGRWNRQPWAASAEVGAARGAVLEGSVDGRPCRGGGRMVARDARRSLDCLDPDHAQEVVAEPALSRPRGHRPRPGAGGRCHARQGVQPSVSPRGPGTNRGQEVRLVPYCAPKGIPKDADWSPGSNNCADWLSPRQVGGHATLTCASLPRAAAPRAAGRPA